MGFLRTEVKIFLSSCFLSMIVFFVTFLVFLPLIYEHRLISFRLSLGYVVNFLYSMSLYLVLSSVLSVVIYRFVKPMRVEGKIFFITFGTIFWAIVGALSTASLYWGGVSLHLLNPFGVIAMWGNLWVVLGFLFISFYLLVISVSVVIMYKIYEFAMGLHHQPTVDQEKRRLESRKRHYFLMNREVKIFVLAFLLVFFSVFFCAFMLTLFYRGYPLIDFGQLNWFSIFLVLFLFFSSFVITSISIILYKVFIRWRRKERNNK